LLHNYFNDLTKLFSDLYLAKFFRYFSKIVFPRKDMQTHVSIQTKLSHKNETLEMC